MHTSNAEVRSSERQQPASVQPSTIGFGRVVDHHVAMRVRSVVGKVLLLPLLRTPPTKGERIIDSDGPLISEPRCYSNDVSQIHQSGGVLRFAGKSDCAR